MLRAAIFDFDGVIIDTEPLHYAAFCEALTSVGIALSEARYYERYVGLADREIVRRLARDFEKPISEQAGDNLLRKKAEVYQRLTDGAVAPLPGAASFVRRCAASMPIAICSGSRRCEIERILKQVSLFDAFSIVVGAEDARASKPDPSGYIMTLNLLRRIQPHISAESCLVFEDSEAGVTAAKAAGMKVVALAVPYREGATRMADATIRGFDNLGVFEFEELTRTLFT